MKRILSIILTLSIVATLFAGLGLNVSAADDGYVTQGGYTYKETDYGFDHANATVPSTGSVVKNATISYWHYDAATSKTTQYTSWFNKSNNNNADTAKLYDSNKNTQFQSIYDSKGTNYLKLKDGATQGSTAITDYDYVDDGSFYLQIQYDLEDNYGNGVDLSQIVVCGEASGWSMGKYDLFISDNIQTLYDTPVKSFTCAETSAYNASNTYNSFSFEEGTTAKYVALRVYKFHTWSDSYIAKEGAGWSLATPHFRMREFNVYGTRSTDNDQNYQLVTAAYNSTGGDRTLSAATAAGIGNNISTSLIRDYAPTEYKYSNLGTPGTADVSKQTITQSNDFKLFEINSSVRFAGTDNKGYKYIIDNENNYQQWIYALDAAANIDSLVVATNQWGTSAISGSLFAPYHVQYSLADNKDDLFVDGASTIYDVYNTDSAAFLTINLTEDVTAKFVGLRVVCGVNKLYPYTEYAAITGNNVAWARLSYFGVNGTYVNPADATVEVEKDAAVADVEAITVSKGEVAQSGTTDTNGKYPVGSIKVTATQDYNDSENNLKYTFKGWYDGEALVSANSSYTYDLTGADVTLTAKYNEESLVTKCTLTFLNASKTVVGELEVEKGKKVDMALVNGIAVKDIYGYKVKRDDQKNVVWDTPLEAEITGDMEITALYEPVQITTAVTVYATDGTTVHYEKLQRYDTVINLDVPNAQSYKDGEGNVLVATATAQLFACGNEMNIYAKKDAAEAPEVAIVGKDHKDYKGFSIFAHVNVENATEYGIIYADSKADANQDFDLVDVNANGNGFLTIKIDATNVGQADFMGTLNYKKGKNPTRYARAYVIVGKVPYYSNVVKNK